MSKYTINEIKELIAMGFTPAQIAGMNADKGNGKAVATSKAKAPKRKGTGAKAPKEPKPQATFVLNGKAVKATGYLPHAVYTWNKCKAIEMGGEVSVADKVFVATFKSEAKAKAYAKVATYEIPEADYEVIKAERAEAQANRGMSKAEKSKANKELAAELRKKLGREFTPEEWKAAKAKAQ